MEIRFLYRDPVLVVCEKPVGVPSESPGLPDLVSQQAGNNALPVHRLDTGTGGAVILAFRADTCTALQRLFQQNRIEKEYLAVLSGSPDGQAGCYTDLLWHDRKKNKSFVVSRSRAGVREARCDWTVVDSARYGNDTLSLVRIRLHTGRTHQIRVQFGSRGCPLVGDRKYGSRIPAETVALWSSGISFPHPDQKSGVISVKSSPPSLVFPWSLFFHRNEG